MPGWRATASAQGRCSACRSTTCGRWPSASAAPDTRFRALLALIEREADDERNYVKKAVNWALRQIGRRNRKLNTAAVACANRLKKRTSSAARWIAADALRELTSDKVQQRLRGR